MRKISLKSKKLLMLLVCFIVCLPVYSYTIRDVYEDYLFGDYHEAIKKAQDLRENDEVLYFLANFMIFNFSLLSAKASG